MHELRGGYALLPAILQTHVAHLHLSSMWLPSLALPPPARYSDSKVKILWYYFMDGKKHTARRQRGWLGPALNLALIAIPFHVPRPNAKQKNALCYCGGAARRKNWGPSWFKAASSLALRDRGAPARRPSLPRHRGIFKTRASRSPFAIGERLLHPPSDRSHRVHPVTIIGRYRWVPIRCSLPKGYID